MNVFLLDYTGIHSPDPFYAARMLVYAKNTRGGQDGSLKFAGAKTEGALMKDLEAVANTIRSSWEFVDFTFQIKDVTRVFTQQLQRTRVGVSFAEQALRVADMSSFRTKIPEAVVDAELNEDWTFHNEITAQLYSRMISNGVPAQDARGILPLNVLTNILVKMNLRTLADLCGKRENLRAQGEYQDVIRECKRLVLEKMPWVKMFTDPERTATPALDKLLKVMLGNTSPVDHPEINAALKELDKLKGTWG